MIRQLSFITLVLLFFAGCKHSTPDFYTTEHGLKYRYHDINSDELIPKRGDYLSVYMKWKTINDSVFYDSELISPSGIDIIKLGKPKHLGGIEEGFEKLQKGDSVSFYIEPNRFYKDYLGRDEIPFFLIEEKEIIITLRLIDIESPNEYLERVEREKEELELNELKNISMLVEQWKSENDSVIEINGSFLVLEETSDTSQIRYGNIIQLNYKASFINGVEFYNTYKNGFPDEFQVGKDAQMVEGLRYAISKMCYGQKGKVLVPSYQGFGSKGSAGNVVPPYTPIIYEIEVLEKK